MKVSEVIGELKIGDTILVKGIVSSKDKSHAPLLVKFGDRSEWISEHAEILLEQPEITHEQAWNKIADAYPASPQSLRNTLDNAVFGHKEKVTVPRFVAEWYVKIKHCTLSEKIRRIESTDNKQLFEWYSSRKGRHNNNMANAQELIAQMDLYGYEIEEPKYYVKLPTLNWNDEASELEEDFAYLILDITSDETRLSGSDSDFKNWRARLTELEIKSIDERYWAFAVPVEGSVEEV